MGALDVRAAHLLAAAEEGLEERVVGQGVDPAGQSAPQPVQGGDGVGLEDRGGPTGLPDAVHQVGGGALGIERLHAHPHLHPVRQLRIDRDRGVERVVARQHQREEAPILVLELEEPADLRERIPRREQVGIVDDQHRVASVLADDRELLVHLGEQRIALRLRLFDPEQLREARENPAGVGATAQHHEHAGLEDLLLEALEQPPHQHRLAGAHLAREHQEPPVLAQAAVQPGQRIARPRGFEEVAQARLVSEGILGEPEVMEVLHVASSHE